MVEITLHAPVTESPEAVAELTRRLSGWLADVNLPRHEAYFLALSAGVWRLVHFGVEDTFQLYTPRDLACTSLVAGGAIINFLIRTAYTRAVIEDDEQLWRTMEDCGIAPTTVAWHAHLRTVPVDNLAQTLADISDPEELATARTIILPRAAGLATTEWLWQVPVETPTISAAMAVRLLALRPDLASSVGTLLAQRRNVLLAREPDPALSLLVQASQEHPQITLAPFEGFYGDGTVVAAAAWHLEHGELGAAHQLASRIRPLSPHANRAYLIAALAAMQLGQADEVKRLRTMIDDRNCHAQLTLRLAELGTSPIADDELLALMDVTTAAEPELYFRALRLLLSRKRLDLARQVCARRQVDYQDHPELGQIIATVLKR